MAYQISAGQIQVIDEHWNEYFCGDGGLRDATETYFMLSLLAWTLVLIILLVINIRKNVRSKQGWFSGIVKTITIIFVGIFVFASAYFFTSSCYMENLRQKNAPVSDVF